MSLVGCNDRDDKNWNDRQMVRAACGSQPVVDIETARSRVIAEQLHFQITVYRTKSGEVTLHEQKKVKKRSKGKYIICKDCETEFTFRVKKQKKYAERGWSDPKRCPCCLQKRRNLYQKESQLTA